MLKLGCKKLYENLIKIGFRFSSSLLLLALGLLVDKFIFNDTYKSWYLNFMLIFPIASSFTRFGLPLQILSKSINDRGEIVNVIKYQIITIISLTFLFLVTSNDIYFLLFICPIGSILFNYGVGKIRNGNIIGYFFQNGIIYLLLIISCLFSDVFFSNSKIIVVFCSIFCVIYLIHNRKSKLMRLDIKNYFTDTINSFIIPFIIFMSFKMSSNLDAGDFIIIKSTSIISATLGSLMLLDFKKIDNISDVTKKINSFISIKKRYINIYVLLVVSTFILTLYLYPDKIIIYLFLVFFETLIYFKGQFNLLNIYFNNQSGIMRTNFITVILTSSFYFSLIFISFKYQEIVLYITGITSFQFFSYLYLKRYENI